jgi:hypothetical protein
MSSFRIKVRVGDIYRQKKHKMSVEIFGKAGEKWKARVLTEKPGVYNGSHKLATFTIWKYYEKVEKEDVWPEFFAKEEEAVLIS